MAGDDRYDGFEAWYAPLRPRVLASLIVVSGDQVLAADATDEAFVRALERWRRVSAMSSPDGWLYRVALHEVQRRGRRRRRGDELARAAAAPHEVDEPALVDPAVLAAVHALPPKARQAVALRYVADLTEREVAEVMGLAPGTVARTLHEARAALAASLAPTHDEEATRG